MKLIVIFTILFSTLVFSSVGQAKIKEKAEQREKVHKQRAIVVKQAKNFLGIKYVFGGESRYGVDCSGLTRLIYKKVKRFLPHFAAAQMQLGKLVHKLRPGDLLFYNNGGHVAMYIGKGKMIHASSYYGRVIKTPLRPGYSLAKRFLYS